MSALEAILAAVPVEYREPLGTKSSTKEAWEAIAAMRVGSDRAKKATAQLLKQEYANLKFKDGETVEDFSLRLHTHQQAEEPWRHHRRREGGLQIPPLRAGKVHPNRSLHRTVLDLSTLTIEDVTGRLRAVDECLEQAIATKDRGKLLLTEEEWAARRNSEKAASSSRGGDGKCRGRASSEKKKQVDPNACWRCGKMGPLGTGVPKSQAGEEG